MTKIELPKYQAKVFKAYADKLEEEASKKFEEAIKDNPELKKYVMVKSNPMAVALREGAYAVCEYFYKEDEQKDENSFSNKDDRKKTVRETVITNLKAYKQIKRIAEDEIQEDYKNIYKTMIEAFNKYFIITAESTMNHRYTDYKEFAVKFREEESKKQKKAKAKRDKTIAAKEAE